MTYEIEKLLKIIEDHLGWGSPASWQSKDFENLNQLIFDKTKVSLSASTLRRIWGRAAYNHLPSTTTLDTLAKFADFESWRAFLKTGGLPQKVPERTQVKAGDHINSYTKVIILLVLVALVTVLSIYAVRKRTPNLAPGSYTFSSQKLAVGIPNSVIFNYDASASPTDSIYIQQSWDPRTRTLVRKDMHEHTSIYYEPGFYQAKLVIGGKVVKQHKLMIPTTGWLGLIENKPVPLYLKPSDFISKNTLGLKSGDLLQRNAAMEFHPTVVKYFNVGNFTPVPLAGFSYKVDVKNEYGEGSAACQFVSVSLITDTGPIIIPLCAKGCVSEISLLSVNWIVSGKTANLSGFGVDFSDWIHVSCKNTGSKIQYFINNKLASEMPMPDHEVKIVGVGFGFQGTGSVKNIELLANGKTVCTYFK
jgi:hypothetical protein